MSAEREVDGQPASELAVALPPRLVSTDTAAADLAAHDLAVHDLAAHDLAALDEAPNGTATNGRAPNGRATNGRATNRRPPNGATHNGRATDGGSPDGRGSNGRARPALMTTDLIATDLISTDLISPDPITPDPIRADLATTSDLDTTDLRPPAIRLTAVDDVRSPVTSTAEILSAIDPAAAPRPPNTADGEPGPAATDAWTLVRRTQDGDAEAFGLLYDRYVDTVYRFVYYRLGDRTQAEDLTSETFLRALRRISTVREQGHDIGAWLVTIARNLVLDHVKSASYRLSVPTEEIVDAHLEQAGDTTEAAALAALDQRALLEAVRLLAPDQQESIVLRFFHGLSLAETAEVMGRNAGAVKALQHRAMQRLHVLLNAPAARPSASGAEKTSPHDALGRHSPRAPPATETAVPARKRYRTRSRRNH